MLPSNDLTDVYAGVNCFDKNMYHYIEVQNALLLEITRPHRYARKSARLSCQTLQPLPMPCTKRTTLPSQSSFSEFGQLTPLTISALWQVLRVSSSSTLRRLLRWSD